MQRYGRWVFGAAGTANLLAAAAMTLGQGLFVQVLALDPVRGQGVIFLAQVGLLVGLFGCGYWQVAFDPERYRPLIWLGVAGKLSAAGLALAGALAIPHLWRFFVLVSGDIVLAGFFLDYLLRSGRERRQSACSKGGTAFAVRAHSNVLNLECDSGTGDPA